MSTTRGSHTQLGQLINEGQVAAGKSLRGLAEECGVDPAYLVRLKRGEVRHPREDILNGIARALDQDVEDYRVALLADHGDLPRWGKVLGTELGIRLSVEDERAITEFVEAMLKHRRGDRQ